MVVVVERLDAEGVTGKEHGSAAAIPDCEGIHSTQARQHLLAVLGVELQQYLGVALRAKRPPPSFELDAKALVVIYLSIERDLQPSIGRRHRLRTCCGHINDGESAMGETCPLIV